MPRPSMQDDGVWRPVPAQLFLVQLTHDAVAHLRDGLLRAPVIALWIPTHHANDTGGSKMGSRTRSAGLWNVWVNTPAAR